MFTFQHPPRINWYQSQVHKSTLLTKHIPFSQKNLVMADQIPRNLTLEEAHNERRDRQINELQQQLAEVLTLLRDGDNNQRRRRQRCQEVEGNSSNEASSESGESDASNQRYGRH